jgi:hypothetical protein
MPEEIFSPELPEEESEEVALARLLTERGFEDSEAREHLIDWIMRQEGLVETSPDLHTRVNFELKRARLYLNAGDRQRALQAFEDAHSIAWNEGDDDFAEQIRQEIEALK